MHVTVTLDNDGLHGPDATFAPGYLRVQFIDRRTEPVGTATLQVSALPNLGVQATLSAGDTERVLLCPHQWYLRAQVNGAPTHETTLGVSGTSPLCTTPIT
jgi:hypothetical protein